MTEVTSNTPCADPDSPEYVLGVDCLLVPSVKVIPERMETTDSHSSEVVYSHKLGRSLNEEKL